jgi:thymidylate synthase (FAD)
MLKDGVAPEQARAVLPLTTETEFVETASLYAYARICHQRINSHAQDEISAIAQEIDSYLRELYPVSWPALMGETL